ncbi:LamG domain-containing protein [bacterium]|nr:LamG domain-containing protein [bacterium]
MKKVFCLLFCILCSSGILSAKLLTHLEFEESLEDSVGDNNGTFTGSDSETYQTGRNGKALVFNGTSDYLEIGNKDFDPRYEGRYSISMWVLSTEQASSTNNNSYIGKHTSSGDNAILFGYWDGKLSLRIKSDLVQISSISEPVNYWAHYVVSAREDNNNGTSSVVIYKNGSQVWSGTLNDVAGDFEEDDKPWVLGMDWDSGNLQTDFFKGKMDDVRIYDWNITADEVKEIYYKEAAKIHLKMDDTFNASAGSISGSGVGGTVFKQGMENRSAYFDGVNDYVQFGYGVTDPRGSGTTTRKYTISLWVKSDAQASSSNNNSYIAKHDSSDGDVFRFGYWNNKLILKIAGSSADVSTATEPTSWTHYVITGTENLSASTTSATVYKNGSQIWTGTISAVMGTFTSSYKHWVLGRRLGSIGDYFKGEIDNVRFYGSVLNAAAIKALYRSEFSGVRYCNTDQNSVGCTIVNDTVYDLGQYSWLIVSGTGFNGIPIVFSVSHTSVESIKVSEGWETFLCTQANHQGTCRYYDDGLYDSTNLLDSSFVNNVYSMTVQPSSFSAAKKFFGYKRANANGNYPAGFAYVYEQISFVAPTKTYSSRRRLFLNSYDRYDFSNNLQNSIIRTNYISSAELYGDVYLEVGDSSNGSKELMTSHNNFSKDMTNYPELDFRTLYHNTSTVVLRGNTEPVGSVGWFLSNDFPVVGLLYASCLEGVSKTLTYNETRIECVEYNYQNLSFENFVSNDPDEFFNRIYNGNRQKFERYADNYSLLMLSGHGSYTPALAYPFSSPETVSISITNNEMPEKRQITINNTEINPYSQKLGNQYTRWMETTACQSMGNNDTSGSEVGNVYYNVLKRLNGVGGYKNDSIWFVYDHQFDTHWEDLTHNNKTVSKAWVDSWSKTYTEDSGRDARFLTLEKCNCSDSSCTGTYMKNDYFYNVSTGPKAQKTNLSEFTHYCFRDKESPNFNGVQRSSSNLPQDYPEEFAAYSYDSLPNYIIEQIFDIKIDENTAKFRGNDRYNYKDDYVIVNRKDKNIQAIMNRKMTSFENEKESEDTIWDKFNEAKYMAEMLTSVQFEYEGISRDVNEAFEVGGNGESLGKMINSVIFVFRPVIDGIPIFSESIEVEYDAEGFYQLRSNVPYSVSETKRSIVKSENDVETEMYSTLGKYEEKIIAYVLNEEGKFILSAVAKDDTNETFLKISLEADHD